MRVYTMASLCSQAPNRERMSLHNALKESLYFKHLTSGDDNDAAV